ncbi:polyprenol phosphomannose-dependent alpha 1,6 mannosyltransferase MptB [Nocardioides sp. Root190]|uniref:polyprenol phosphomannose-dependent alpha 1,6 mannosyltransferase MptB n=1 Tax=Nocardioides sp. Root190 TaxID=1736488 RepID=UPI0012F9C329|nr:polyprenol phosphomannose-dependent alpha 1,6 mannosyltransferase MptB [Nocardioides sp. Root190]
MITRGLVGGMLVLLGGLLTATLPPSTPVLKLAVLGAVRAHEVGRMAGLVVVLVGLGLLASAWLQLCRTVAVGDRQTGDAEEGVALVRFAAAVWCAPLVLAPPLFSRDGWSYAAQGMLARVGLSPYDWGPGALAPDNFLPLPTWLTAPPIVQAVDPLWWDTATPYGPVPVAFGAVVAGTTGNPWLLVIAHRGFALVGLVLLAWAVPRLAAWSGANPAVASAIVLVSPLMMANGVAGLHNDLLMVGLMAAALVVAVERGWVWGAALAGVAAGVKVPGGLVCVGIALVALPVGATVAARLRRLTAVGAVSVGTLLGLGVLTGLGNGWLNALTVPGEVNTPLSATTLVGGVLDFFALHLGVDTGPAFFRDVVRALGLVAALGTGAWVALRWRTGSRTTALAGVAAATAAFVLLSPVVHLWYFLMLPPFVATLRLRRHAMGALIGLSLLLGLVAPLDSSLHGAYYAIVLGCMTVALLLPVLLLTRSARESLARIVAPLAPPAGALERL